MSSAALISPPPFDPHRFKSTADYYLQGRLPYPSKLVQRIAEHVGIGPDDRVLDLGCGPGFLAVAFRPLTGEVVGIDPEPEMLAAAERYALQSGVDVTFQQGSSYDLGAALGKFRLVTMGRSFHWMDREATLKSLDALIEPDGAVALFSDTYLDLPENAWRSRYTQFLDSFKKNDPARDVARSSSPRKARHEPVLLKSSFSSLERISVVRRLETSVEQLEARALSYSGTSPERLGAQKEAFVDNLKNFLRQESPSGRFIEVIESEALLAYRPNESRYC